MRTPIVLLLIELGLVALVLLLRYFVTRGVLVVTLLKPRIALAK